MSKDPKPLRCDDSEENDVMGTLSLTDEQIDTIIESGWMLEYFDLNEPYVHCECGKDKHGFANHSTWCPKYES